jgi:ketosteroid isomerase-like protein
MSAAVITSFYEAFARKDGEAMAAAYADDVRFSDPVFTELRGERARNMWRMFCERGIDLEVTFRDVTFDDAKKTGTAHWDATYTFALTKKRVHNAIDAAFVFRDGKIVEHVDTFDLRRWCGMALGIPGKLFGWAPFLHTKLRKTAGKTLDDWAAKRGAPPTP